MLNFSSASLPDLELGEHVTHTDIEETWRQCEYSGCTWKLSILRFGR